MQVERIFEISRNEGVTATVTRYTSKVKNHNERIRKGSEALFGEVCFVLARLRRFAPDYVDFTLRNMSRMVVGEWILAATRLAFLVRHRGQLSDPFDQVMDSVCKWIERTSEFGKLVTPVFIETPGKVTVAHSDLVYA